MNSNTNTNPDVMLFHTDLNAPFELHVDARKRGCEAMLIQEKDDIFRPVRFVCRAFTPAESSWTTLHQELFTVKCGLEQLCSYILGGRIKVVIDHANLKWLTARVPQQTCLQAILKRGGLVRISQVKISSLACFIRIHHVNFIPHVRFCCE